jgi:hypothetical protein
VNLLNTVILLCCSFSLNAAFFGSLRTNLRPLTSKISTPQTLRLFSSHLPSSQEEKTNITQKDFNELKHFIHTELDTTKKYLSNQNYWDIDVAKEKMIEDIQKDGHSHEEAISIFTKIDQEIDHDRNIWNIPYYGSLVFASMGIPLTWVIVYNPTFYNKVLEIWPWLEETSWDWTEPLVQGLLTTQTQGAIIFTSLVALGFRPYQNFRNNKMATKVAKKWGVDKAVAKKFIKVDR